MYSETTATIRIKKLNKRIRAVQGGSSASKTISILLYLIAMAQSDKKPTVTSVVAESIPHLKRGAMRDFKDIMVTHHYWKDANWNVQDSTYTFETGSIIEFFSTDNGDKLRGARRHRCFMNEANNCTFEAFEQLEIRTKEFFFLDWNPSNEFWFYTEILPKRADVEHIILTYKDNEALDQSIVDSLEQRKNRVNWWKVYGEGQLGEVEGRIYTGWNIIDEIPHEARLERYGLDFGYTNDPSAIVAVYYYNGGYILDEVVYQKGLSNKQLADILINQKRALIIADSAEPKSIDELRSFGLSVSPTTKGPGSVLQRIQLVQDQKISVTKRSVNILKEYRNYLWEIDKNGQIVNEPSPIWNHCFAPETLVHTTEGLATIESLVGKEGYLYSRDGTKRRFYNVRPTRADAEVLSLYFDDGDVLTVTPDHLLLQANGTWCEAQLLNPMDLIQSATYGKANFQWKYLQDLFGGKVFKQGKKEAPSSSVGAPQWGDPIRDACPPQGWKPEKQSHFKSRIKTSPSTPFRAHDAGAERGTEEMGRQNTTSSRQVAFIRRGGEVAQVTWEECNEEQKAGTKGVLSLPQNLFYNSLCKINAFLRKKLRYESPTKTVTRIERGRRTLTFNMEVEGTHCLLANGVIAHNSMDALGYAMTSLVPLARRREMYPPSHAKPRARVNVGV